MNPRPLTRKTGCTHKGGCAHKTCCTLATGCTHKTYCTHKQVALTSRIALTDKVHSQDRLYPRRLTQEWWQGKVREQAPGCVWKDRGFVRTMIVSHPPASDSHAAVLPPSPPAAHMSVCECKDERQEMGEVHSPTYTHTNIHTHNRHTHEYTYTHTQTHTRIYIHT